MELNPDIYNIIRGGVLGLIAGIGIGICAWHRLCQARGWYGDEQKKIRGASRREVYA